MFHPYLITNPLGLLPCNYMSSSLENFKKCKVCFEPNKIDCALFNFLPLLRFSLFESKWFKNKVHWFTIRLLEERVVNLWEAVFIQWRWYYWQVNEAEKERNESEQDHRHIMIKFQDCEEVVHHLQRELKRAIAKSK